MKNVIVVVGPTASGKTSLSIELAKRLNGEIISADSMQVYRMMDIGTAKPSIDEMEGIRHYLIDEVNPDVEFNVVRFKELAELYIEKIINEGKQPVVVGGTGLYISSLINNISFSQTECDQQLRNELNEQAEKYGAEYIHNKLREVDPTSADSIHPNNVKRVIRALEVYYQTQKPISYHNEISKSIPSKYNFILIGLTMDRQRLYDRIDKRVDMMIKAGLIDEVKSIIEAGYGNCQVAMQGIGYKQIIAYFNNEITQEEAIDLIKRDSRRYAKRQITWFKRIKEINWFNIDNYGNNSIVNDVISLIKGNIAQSDE